MDPHLNLDETAVTLNNDNCASAEVVSATFIFNAASIVLHEHMLLPHLELICIT